MARRLMAENIFSLSILFPHSSSSTFSSFFFFLHFCHVSHMHWIFDRLAKIYFKCEWIKIPKKKNDFFFFFLLSLLYAVMFDVRYGRNLFFFFFVFFFANKYFWLLLSKICKRVIQWLADGISKLRVKICSQFSEFADKRKVKFPDFW